VAARRGTVVRSGKDSVQKLDGFATVSLPRLMPIQVDVWEAQSIVAGSIIARPAIEDVGLNMVRPVDIPHYVVIRIEWEAILVGQSKICQFGCRSLCLEHFPLAIQFPVFLRDRMDDLIQKSFAGIENVNKWPKCVERSLSQRRDFWRLRFLDRVGLDLPRRFCAVPA